jgi:hypothetical protein
MKLLNIYSIFIFTILWVGLATKASACGSGDERSCCCKHEPSSSQKSSCCHHENTAATKTNNLFSCVKSGRASTITSTMPTNTSSSVTTEGRVSVQPSNGYDICSCTNNSEPVNKSTSCSFSIEKFSTPQKPVKLSVNSSNTESNQNLRYSMRCSLHQIPFPLRI